MSLDRRFDLTEIGDLPWLPSMLRDAIGDMLRALNRVVRPFDGAAPVLRRLLRAADDADAGAAPAPPSPRHPAVLIDLASGGGGPLLDLMARPGLLPPDCVALLTDLHPNEGALTLAERRLPGRAIGVRASVDAARVPADLAAFSSSSPATRCCFNALHHLSPHKVAAAMRDATRARAPFAAFEVVERHPLALLSMALAMPLLAAAVAPLARPLLVVRRPSLSPLPLPLPSPSALLLVYFTFIIPLVPLVVAFDGFVSCLRAYSIAELQEMCDAANKAATTGGGGGYRWRVGVAPRAGLLGGWTPFRLVWLEGRPVAVAESPPAGAAAAAH